MYFWLDTINIKSTFYGLIKIYVGYITTYFASEIIPLERMQNFLKNLYFSAPNTHTSVHVSGGRQQFLGNFQIGASPIKCQCCPHIKTSQLICIANQLTGFYMTATLALNQKLVNLFCIANQLTGFYMRATLALNGLMDDTLSLLLTLWNSLRTIIYISINL